MFNVEILSFQEPPAASSLPSFNHGSVPSKLEALAREKQLKHEYPLFKVGAESFSYLPSDKTPFLSQLHPLKIVANLGFVLGYSYKIAQNCRPLVKISVDNKYR